MTYKRDTYQHMLAVIIIKGKIYLLWNELLSSPLYAEFSIRICSITGGTPQVSTAEVAFDLPFHLPLPAPIISTCLKIDLDLDTYKVLSDLSSFLNGALSNLRPLQCPSAALFSLWWNGWHLRPKFGWWSQTPEPIFLRCHWHLCTLGS